MVAQYEYVACDLRTNAIRDSVRLTGVSYEEALNGRGMLTASIPRADRLATRDVLRENDTALYVLRNGACVWGGYVESIQAKGRQRSLELTCPGFLNYLSHRTLRESRTYTGQDQATIMADLVNYTMGLANPAFGTTAGPGGGLPFSVNAPATGVTRDRSYDGIERPEIGQLLKALTEVQNGPDMAVQSVLDADANGNRRFTNTFRVWAERGTSQVATLIYGGNVSDYAITYDGSQQGTYVEAMNDADSADRLIVAADSGKPVVWDRIVQRSKVIDTATLQGWANVYLQTYAETLVLPSVELLNPTDPEPQALLPGDTVRLIIMDGYVQVDGSYRVVARKVQVGTGGAELMSVAFAPPDATGGNPDA